jgi:hypothetical protein
MATMALTTTLRNRVLAIGVCASLAVDSLGFATNAEARAPSIEHRNDTQTLLCSDIQDSWDRAKRQRDNPASSAQEREAARATMRGEVRNWYANNCDERYGQMGKIEAVNTGHGADLPEGTIGASPENPLPRQSIGNVPSLAAR